MKISKREGILLVILILAACTALFANFVYNPGEKRIKELSVELESNKKALTVLKELHNEAAKHLQEVGNIDNEIRLLERKLPSVMDMPGITVQFYRLITDSRLTGDNIIFNAVTEGEKYDFYTISFSAKGKRGDIDSFLKQLESFKNQVSIAGLHLEAAEQDYFNMDLRVDVYMFKSDKESLYTPDYYFMEDSSVAYKKWYEMFKAMEIGQEMD